MTDHNWTQVGDLLHLQFCSKRRYSAHIDPQAIRARYMRRDRLTYFEAIQRWPLAEYGKTWD